MNVRAQMLLHFALGASWSDLAVWGGYASAGRARTAVWRYVARLAGRRRRVRRDRMAARRRARRYRAVTRRLLAHRMETRERERA